MSRTRYREERTMVRALQRLPGQDRDEFRKNVLRLRRHFERFNLDVSEICQWLVSFRSKNSDEVNDTRLFWEFMLEPERSGAAIDPRDPAGDWLRHSVFTVVVGWEPPRQLETLQIPDALRNSLLSAADRPRSQTAETLLVRLRSLDRSHVMVLLKSATEWLNARYVRQEENWRRHTAEWQKEKEAWESEHPELTPELREKYNGIFKELGIRDKRPRICSAEHLLEGKDNCEWAGQRVKAAGVWASHSPLCLTFDRFVRQLQGAQKKHFTNNARNYLDIQRSHPDWTQSAAMNELWRKEPKAKSWFAEVWNRYLEQLGIKEVTILQDYAGRLPHCEKLGMECSFNKHTNQCTQYRNLLLDRLGESERSLEELYREWRSSYLAAPGKPSLRYPSAHTLPTPKLFGRGYYELDFQNAIVKLRLDDMGQGQYLTFGFKPWPKDYDYQPQHIQVTSVHIHFFGTRARIGLRFTVPHKTSRFGVSQDDIDNLRSREFPRQSQDNAFLAEARKLLLDSLPQGNIDDVKVMAVDLGSTSGAAAFFRGRTFEKAELLSLTKLDLLAAGPPAPTKGEKLTPDVKAARKARGLTTHHVGKHLDTLRDEVLKISAKRGELTAPEPDGGNLSIREHDMRHLTSHIRRMIRDWVRLNASQIIKRAEEEHAELIVFESLRGFRAPGYDKLEPDKKRRLAFFAYGHVRRKVTEKAVERGMRVVTVPYYRSSQLCAACGSSPSDMKKWEKNKREGEFICDQDGCGFKTHSDINAARLLGRVFWGEIDLPTTQKVK